MRGSCIGGHGAGADADAKGKTSANARHMWLQVSMPPGRTGRQEAALRRYNFNEFDKAPTQREALSHTSYSLPLAMQTERLRVRVPLV